MSACQTSLLVFLVALALEQGFRVLFQVIGQKPHGTGGQRQRSYETTPNRHNTFLRIS